MMEVAGTFETQKTAIFTVKGYRRGDRPATHCRLHIPWLCRTEWDTGEGPNDGNSADHNIDNVRDDGYHFVSKGKLILFY